MMNFKLSNGVEIPAMGIGTFMIPSEEAQGAVLTALENGYRMIDTANAYVNEKAVGRAIKESGVVREDIFLSTKLWPTVYEAEDAVEKTLERLQTDYIDLLFIHQPAGNYMAGYRQLEKAYKDGIIKTIGISNFQGEKLKSLLANAEIKPHVIQLEAHPYCTEDEIMNLLKDCGTRLMAWYPLGHGDQGLLKEEIFTILAKKYNKSNAQIVLRWHTQMGLIVIPGSKNPEHIKANIDIFDFTLTEDEMTEIAKLNQGKKYYIATDEQVEQFAAFEPGMDAEQ